MQQGKLVILVMVALITACHAKQKSPPTQVVYRFDDHRYLELTGYHCEGGLRYIDTERNIQHQIYDVSDGYRIFTKTFIHPSERYIAITSYEGGGFAISKDYGKTWDGASYSPGGGAIKYGDDRPQREEIESFTVVNDQGFMLTKKGDLYLSSKPFDDPRLEPGGSGIDYTYTYRGDTSKHHLEPINSSVGSLWGKNYVSWISIQLQDPWQTFAYQTNFQNIPNKVPEVKNYKGWDHMRCNPDLGLEASEQQK
ncbi:T6SS immunity protein Tli3 family protein [Buttiauxella agrestis]|uniref:Tli3-like domain-containing protein n=1 Tax=Buttiauxella agrestis ATCC 33320 TaxID=1006004 RepID=A0A085GIC4_9ENTR|nr:hypothetical protein [Buttiauxella agrestis]KFC83469.1 hypothetical protein GBAG_0908 [Buttiauxella agrestis ATCC 33320]